MGLWTCKGVGMQIEGWVCKWVCRSGNGCAKEECGCVNVGHLTGEVGCANGGCLIGEGGCANGAVNT